MFMLLLPTAVAFVPALKADVFDLQSYTINFNLNNGHAPAPTAGSFTYDPDNHTFSNFLVTWDGIQFDLTNSANNPTVVGSALNCITGTGGAASFAFMTGSCASNQFISWDGVSNQFSFGDVEGAAGFVIVGTSSSSSSDLGNGGWTVTQQTTSPVPEPSSLILLAGVIGWVLFDLKRRFSKKSVIH
jgi:hypothetical protein